MGEQKSEADKERRKGEQERTERSSAKEWMDGIRDGGNAQETSEEQGV